MPDITRHGVTLKASLQEAAASALVTRAVLYCYEMWHPTFASPIRWVNNNEDITATLEAAAPRNAGTAQAHVACITRVKRPEESDQAATPRLQLARSDVGALVMRALDAAIGSLAPFELIERVYASDALGTLALDPPLRVEVTSFTIAEDAVSLSAQGDDLANVAIPSCTFNRIQYPGLQR